MVYMVEPSQSNKITFQSPRGAAAVSVTLNYVPSPHCALNY